MSAGFEKTARGVVAARLGVRWPVLGTWWRRACLAVSVAALGCGTAGCSTLPARTATAAPSVQQAPIPDGVTTQPLGSAPPPTGCGGSLRPGTLPKPGQMPAGSTMDRIVRRGYLIAGVDEDSYLFGYRNPSSDPAAPPLIGFDIDFVREVSRALFGTPDRVRYKTITKAQRISALTDGSVDLVADIMTVDCDRAKHVAFSAYYFDAGQRILVDQASTINGLSDLAGKKTCAAAGTTSIQTLADPRYRVVPVSAVNWADCLVMLQQGQVDAVSTTDLILVGIQAEDPYTKIVGPQFTDEEHGLAMPLGEDDFVRFVNGVLEQLKADGTWTAIYSRWIGDRLGPVPLPPTAEYRD
jgi:polar amino acid transport system substrate-binding protein